MGSSGSGTWNSSEVGRRLKKKTRKIVARRGGLDGAAIGDRGAILTGRGVVVVRGRMGAIRGRGKYG